MIGHGPALLSTPALGTQGRSVMCTPPARTHDYDPKLAWRVGSVVGY